MFSFQIALSLSIKTTDSRAQTAPVLDRHPAAPTDSSWSQQTSPPLIHPQRHQSPSLRSDPRQAPATPTTNVTCAHESALSPEAQCLQQRARQRRRRQRQTCEERPNEVVPFDHRFGSDPFLVQQEREQWLDRESLRLLETGTWTRCTREVWGESSPRATHCLERDGWSIVNDTLPLEERTSGMAGSLDRTGRSVRAGRTSSSFHGELKLAGAGSDKEERSELLRTEGSPTMLSSKTKISAYGPGWTDAVEAVESRETNSRRGRTMRRQAESVHALFELVARRDEEEGRGGNSHTCLSEDM